MYYIDITFLNDPCDDDNQESIHLFSVLVKLFLKYKYNKMTIIFSFHNKITKLFSRNDFNARAQI